MTEDEAKTKWCPFIRETEHPDGVLQTNRSDLSRGSWNCIGSACMAWRWKMTWDETGIGVEENFHGYCGLAGEA